MNKNQKTIASGFMKSIKHEPRKNGMFITYFGTHSFQTGDINKKFILIIEEEKEVEK